MKKIISLKGLFFFFVSFFSTWVIYLAIFGKVEKILSPLFILWAGLNIINLCTAYLTQHDRLELLKQLKNEQKFNNEKIQAFSDFLNDIKLVSEYLLEVLPPDDEKREKLNSVLNYANDNLVKFEIHKLTYKDD